MRLPLLAGAFLFCVHATAILVAAVPEPARLAAVTGERESADDRLSRHVRPILDQLIPGLEFASRAAWRATRPLRPILGRYTAAFRLSQGWRMFAQPPRGNSYLAVCAEYFGSAERRCEVINPEVPPARFKGLLAYRSSFRDKAISNAVEGYLELKIKDPAVRPSVRTRFGEDIMGTVGRHFAQAISTGRPRWVEVWHAGVAMPRRGEFPDASLDLPSWPAIDLPRNRIVGAVARAGSANWMLLRAGPP